jgi:hypothetical protein
MSTGGLIHLRTHSAMRFTTPTIVTSTTIRHANGRACGPEFSPVTIIYEVHEQHSSNGVDKETSSRK